MTSLQAHSLGRLLAAALLLALATHAAGCGGQGGQGSGPASPGGSTIAQAPLPPSGPAAPIPSGPGFTTGASEPDPTLSGGDSGSASGGSGTPPSTAPGAQGERSAFEQEVDRLMLLRINQERAAVGAQPLRFEPHLVDAAWKHALDMFNRNYIGHEAPEGLWPVDRAGNAGFSPADSDHVNENVADLFPRDDPQALANVAIDMYRQSDGHWQNLLDPKWNVVGLATVYRPGQAPVDGYGVQKVPNAQLFGMM